MEAGKIIKFLSLRGKGLEDCIKILIAKIFFLIYYFVLREKGKGIGDFLFSDAIAKTGYGLFYCKKRCSDLAVISESTEYNTFKFFRPKKGNIVIDCGAHIGKYTIYASKLVGKYGKVISFEPLPFHLETLLKNIQINHCENVHAFNYACWDNNIKNQKLFVGRSDAEYSLIKRNNKYIKIRTIRLDYILKKMNIKSIDWIKIDVEGAELKVLKGLGKYIKKTKNMIIEIHSRKKQVFDFLKRNGYTIYKIPYDENYFCKLAI
jgi:FkbM family methyltransferase